MGEFIEFYANIESESESEADDSLSSLYSDSSDEEYVPIQKKSKFPKSNTMLSHNRTSNRNQKAKNVIESEADSSDEEYVPLQKKPKISESNTVFIQSSTSKKGTKNKKNCEKKTGARNTRSSSVCMSYQNKSKASKRDASSVSVSHYRQQRPRKPDTGLSKARNVSVPPTDTKNDGSAVSHHRKQRPRKPNTGISKARTVSVSPTKTKNAESAEMKKRKTLKRKSNIQGKTKGKGSDWKSGHFTPKLFDFDTSLSGLSPNVPQNSSYDELFFFELFFDDKLVDIIVEQSNKYHESIPVRCKDSNKRKHQKPWVEINRNEMYVFLATFMLMSAVKKSKIQEYWTNDPLIETPIFKKIMPRDRFLEILRALHFNDNGKQVSGDRLFKIRPVMELLKERFPFYINAHKNLAIDESLMLWKGRLCFKQFIASKRHRFGVKLFVLCDCETGAILDFIVYTGSTTEIMSFEDLGISGSVVMTLLQPYLGKGHSVFLDNWYSSPKLYNALQKQQTGACGTVRKNRQEMPEFDKLEKGEIIHLNKNNLMAFKWQDKRDVHMLTTLHEPGFGPTKKKNYKDDKTIWKPLAIIDYNANMGPIDKSDMQMSFSECVRKTVKWYKKFFFHLVDITVFNCNIMATMKSGEKCSLGKFRNELVRKLISKYGQIHTPKQRTSSAASIPYPKRLIDRHFPTKIKTDGGSRLKTRTCYVCSHSKQKEKKRSSSRYECTDCNVGLCVSDCFKQYHTLLHF